MDIVVENITKNLGLPINSYPKYWFILNTLDEYVLLHYNEEEDIEDKNILALRGVIYDTLENKIVCKSYPYSPSIDTEDITPYLKEKLKFCYEGAVLRIWKSKGKMYISTHKKINCHKSRWGNSKFFPELLKDLWGISLEEIEKLLFDRGDACHVFILSHPSLLITSLKPAQGIIYMGCFIGESNYKPDGNVSYPKELNEEEAISLFKESEAIICFTKDDIFKLIPSEVRWRNKMIDNNPNRYNRYYQLLDEKEGDLIRKFDDKEKEKLNMKIENWRDLVAINFYLASPLHLREEISTYPSRYLEDKKYVIDYLTTNYNKLKISLEDRFYDKHGQLNNGGKVIKRIISTANPKWKGNINNSIKDLINKEYSKTLYSLIKVLREDKKN